MVIPASQLYRYLQSRHHLPWRDLPDVKWQIRAVDFPVAVQGDQAPSQQQVDSTEKVGGGGIFSGMERLSAIECALYPGFQ